MTAARGSMARPDNHVIVLFGATGDLARRKLLPGLFHLAVADLLPRRYRIIGSARRRSALSDADFRQRARQAALIGGTGGMTGVSDQRDAAIRFHAVLRRCAVN